MSILGSSLNINENNIRSIYILQVIQIINVLVEIIDIRTNSNYTC